ncbi:MAG TPA: lipid-A-disaccharide synthase [Verrucomicrobiae bacterium]
MNPLTFMLIAGEASGDALAAELVAALRAKVVERESVFTNDVQPLRTALAPRFFGAGGPKMAAAGVELALDLTRHSVIGVSDVLRKLGEFRRLLQELRALAIERQPDVIIGVDYGEFNLRFAKAIKAFVCQHHSHFTPWNPKIVRFVSPQVWASRAGRARVLERTHDLVLSIFPFEKDWYAARVPGLRVEFVGHPMVERFRAAQREAHGGPPAIPPAPSSPRVVFLPGSRWDEVRRHWPVVTGVFALLRRDLPGLSASLVLPSEVLAHSAQKLDVPTGLNIQIGNVSAALAEADLAITKSGTITLECAFHGVPAVVFYKTSWPTYWIARRVVKVKHLAMPNLLAGEAVFPEFIQAAATPENIARASLDLLGDAGRRQTVKAKLAEVVATLGPPGAARRAAEAIVRLLP